MPIKTTILIFIDMMIVFVFLAIIEWIELCKKVGGYVLDYFENIKYKGDSND